MKVKVAPLRPTIGNPMAYTVHGILQTRTLEWVAIPFSRGSSQPRDRTQVSHVQEDCLPAEPPGKPLGTGRVGLNLRRIYVLGSRVHVPDVGHLP